MNRQLRQQIRSKGTRRKTEELHLWARIFNSCINSQGLPAIHSPAHLKLKEIIQWF